MKKNTRNIIRFAALTLALATCVLSMTGCIYKLIFGGSSGAKLFGDKITLKDGGSVGHLTYAVPEGLEADEDDSTRKRYELENGDGGRFYVRLEKHSVLLSFTDMQNDAGSIEEDEDNKDIKTESAKFNGTKWAMIRYSRYDSDLGGDVEMTVYYGTYDRMGVREWYKIVFYNTAENRSFVDAFMKKTKIS